MKRILLPAVLAAIAFASCKEVGPAIDFGPKAVDTSYMAAVETPQQRMVVMEEFTGVQCGPCFEGHKIVKALLEKYPGRIAVMGIQHVGPIQSRPLDSTKEENDYVGTRHDNRTQDGTDLANELYGGISSIPNAGIDRIKVGGGYLSLKDKWAATVESRLPVAAPANIKITTSYNESSHQAIINVRVAYTQAVSKPQLLSVALLEDHVIDAQEGGDTTNFTKFYDHRHVLRDILTSPVGSVILSNYPTKAAGLVYERTFVYDVNQAWNIANCSIVAYVSNNDGADKEVVQGAEAELKP